MEWIEHARTLADYTSHRGSRWYHALAATPRSELVPQHWVPGPGDTWRLSADPVHDAYLDEPLTVRVGELHADHAAPTASGPATLTCLRPSVMVELFRRARRHEDMRVLEIGTGTAYGTALLCHRHMSETITTVEVDAGLAATARRRLRSLQMFPEVLTGDAMLPATLGDRRFERVVSGAAVGRMPLLWLDRLPIGGRLVAPIAGTRLVLDVERTTDGAAGTVFEVRDRIAPLRRAAPPAPAPDWETAAHATGGRVTLGRYPVADLTRPRQLETMMALACPGLAHRHEHGPGGLRTAIMAHPDGSWARAAALPGDPPTVHQSGPRALWDEYERACEACVAHGQAPYLTARASVGEDGRIRLTEGDWSVAVGDEHAGMLR
jgi:protein-L-isoaspartate O-methyltransferase